MVAFTDHVAPQTAFRIFYLNSFKKAALSYEFREPVRWAVTFAKSAILTPGCHSQIVQWEANLIDFQ